MNSNLLNRDDFIYVRGIPVARWEIAQFEQKFGGMLFDETNMPTPDKKVACANVITSLDKQLAVMRGLRRNPDYLPESVDVGDPGWLYIPVAFEGLSAIPTRDKPAGIVGWFRVKKLTRVA
jgi:hypothetical protein